MPGRIATPFMQRLKRRINWRPQSNGPLILPAITGDQYFILNGGNGAPFRIKLRTHIPLKYRYNFPRCIVRRRYRFRRHGQSAIDGFCDERLPTIHLAKVGLPSKRTEPSPTSRQCCYKPPLRPAQISHSCSLQPSESRFIRRIFLNGQSNEPSVRSDVHGYILSE